MTTDIYKEHLLRRWTMNELGEVECHHDAIDIRLHSDEVINAVKAHNSLLKTARDQKNAYLVARSKIEPVDEPTHLVEVDEEGNETEVSNPVWTEWNEALLTVQNTPDTVKAWVLTTETSLDILASDLVQAQAVPEPEDEPQMLSEVDEEGNETEVPNPVWTAWNEAQEVISSYDDRVAEYEAALALWNETFVDSAPVFEVVTDGPALHPLVNWAFWTMVDEYNLRQPIYDAIDAMFDNSLARNMARNRFEKTPVYNAEDDMFKVLMPIVGLTTEQFNTMWMTAKALQEI